MSRDKDCRETIFVSQLPRNYAHRGGSFERGKKALSYGWETVWEAFQETIWARVIAIKNCCETVGSLDGRNRATVIAESLARVIAAIRIASIRWRSHLPRKYRN